ncbi:PREDICTED: threonylcarbamoyladenosine tRNA methylthiotransferase-like, partial [Acropora digitifera]|uniref:threonylcarbamoyladenosine tRNA methylthiotransferase-like n=1 Tax=Acropora digitifera TaxID=70779 RepID=UPI00077A5B67
TGHTVRLLGQKKVAGKKSGGAPLDLPKIRKNPLIEIIAINTGCLNQCSYCKTKHARGDLGSYPPEEIVARAKQAFEGRYLHNLDEMAKILSHPRVYSFLHVPVQSASDNVLADMKREYCADDFRNVVDFLKEKVPGVTIATDVICGFPTETWEDFQETVALVEQYKFPSLFINQFYPRPGTPAARMKRLPTEEVKRRTREISKLFHSYQPYDHKVGERQIVLITEDSKDGAHFVGHNKYYDQASELCINKNPSKLSFMWLNTI